MAQQNIDFGTFPDDPDADAIRTAFQKVQQNFDEIYDSTANAAVLSINRSQGAGITVNGPTGNVIVSANIASIQFSSVTLKVGTSPSPTSNTASYTNYSQTLYIEIPNNLSIGNLTANGFISATGNLTVANANLGNLATANFFSGSGNNLSNIQGSNVTGPVGSANTAGTVTTNAQPNITGVGILNGLQVSGNITPTANITYDLGNNTNRFKDIYLANSTIYLGNATVQANANALTLTNPLGGQLIVSGNSVSYSNSIVNGNSNVDVSLNGNVTVSVAGNANIFTVTGTGANVNGSINSLNASLGNAVTANYFIGSGANLTNIPSGNISGQVGNALVAGTVYTAAQPNITSLGTVTSLSVSGNANIGNVGTGGLITATGNITAGNLVTGGALNVTGDANVGNIGANNGVFTSIAGTLTTAAQPNVTSTGTLTSISVSGNANIGNIGTAGLITATGNVTGGNLTTGGLITATGNIGGGNLVTGGVVTATGNVIGGNIETGGLITAIGSITGGNLSTGGILSVGGNANVGNIGGNNAVFTTLTGTLSTAVQPNITSTGTLASLSVSGNATITNLSVTGNLNAGDITVGAIANGNSNVDITNTNGNVTISVDGVANVATFTSIGANVTGNITAGNVSATTFTGALSGAATSATTAGTVTTNSQPNITSLGTLTGLTVNGTANLGAVGNVKITGGSSNGYLFTDGIGNLSFGSIVNTPPGGANNDVQFKDGGTYQGSSNFTFDPTSNLVSITGNLSVTGNANVGNIGANNIVGTLTTASQPNITSLGQLIGLSLLGNLNSNSNIVLNNVNANISTLGNISANYFIGNIQGANVIGAVANATYAVTSGTTNSVALANVSGAGNIASINISGNSSQILYGNGVFAAASVTYGNSDVATFLASYGSNTITTTGNVSVGNIIGNGQALTGLAGANVIGQVGNALVAGTVYTNAQPNITSVGTLTDLSVSGNGVIGGNLTVNGTLTYINSTTLSISDPIINLQTGANGVPPIANSGKDVGTALNYYDTSAKIAWMGWDVSNSEITFGSNVGISNEVVTFTELANIRSGNAQLGNMATANYFTGNGSGISALAGGNITGQVANALVAGTVYTNAQPNITSVGTLTSLAVTGNISAGNVSATTFTGALSGAATSATTAGTVTTAAQPNITSVGTLTSLSSSGNVTAGNLITGGLITVTGNVNGGNLVSTGQIGGTGATHLGNTFTTGANTTTGTVTGNFSLSAGSKFQATYA